MVDISRIDLNLFVVFDAIYTEGGITRASERLNLTQPAVSHALGRLRDVLGDPLFVREGQQMVPTPLANELIRPIRGAIREIEFSLHQLDRFDPATCSKTFTLGVRHIVESVYVPGLVERMRGKAPHVKLNAVRHDRHSIHSALSSGELDAVVDVLLPHSETVSCRLLDSSELVVAVRNGHPGVAGDLSLEEYLQLDHVMATSRRSGPANEDWVLQRHGLKRKIAVRCQHYWTACQVVAATDLALTMPQRFAASANAALGNQIVPFPIRSTTQEAYMYWHAQSENNPTSRWFRDQIVQSFGASLRSGPMAP